MLACALYSFFYVLEISTSDLGLSKLFLKLEYIGAVMLAPLLFLFARKYVNNNLSFQNKDYLLLFAFPAFILLINLSNEFHHFSYQNLSLKNNGYFFQLNSDKGIVYWLHQAYAAVLSLWGNLILIGFLFKVPKQYQVQVSIISLGSLMIWLAYLFQLSGLVPYGLDAIPFGFLLLGLMINAGLTKLKLFKLQPLAYKSLFMGHSDGVILFDTEGELVECNKSALHLLGFGNAINSTDLFNKWPELKTLAKLDIDHKESIIERRADNDIYYYTLRLSIIRNDDGESIGKLISITDDTNKRAIQKEKERLIDFIKQTNAMAKTGGWELDLVNNKLIWSEVTNEIHEVESNYIPDLANAINFYKKEYTDLVKKSLDEAIEKGIVYDLEVILKTAKGNDRWVRTKGKPEIIDGKCVRVYGAIQDIHEQKLTEQALRDAQENTKKLLDITSEQNKRLSNFTYIISHNIRSNIANLEGLISILDLDDKDEAEANIQLIKDAVLGLDDTIKNLNDIINIQNNTNLPLAPINIRKKIEEIVNGLDILIREAELDMLINIDENAILTTNLAYFESIFQNLITNGIKYRNKKKKAYINISYKKENNQHIFNVKDNGLGMDMSKVGEKIFGLYKTFHGNEDAKGLGLFITKSQVEALGGHINLQSELNKGTIFKITFYGNN